MAEKTYSFTLNVISKEAESESRRATVTTSFKDANGLDNSYATPVDTVNASSVNRAISDGLKRFSDAGVQFVKVEEKEKDNGGNPPVDGFQGDVPDSEKPSKDDDGDSDKASDKKDDKKPAEPKPVAPAPAPDKPAAGDKPAAPKK